MKLSDYEYELPQDRIALHPPKVRGESRLLVLNRKTGSLHDALYKDLPTFLRSGDVLVINNTKVLPARLTAQTKDGAIRELLLLEKHGEQQDEHTAIAMHKGRLRAGQTLHIGGIPVVIEEVYPGGTVRVSATKSLWDLAEQSGEVPLPPYMHRKEEPADRERYQTVFAKEKGSVAAPTASLNMTNELLEKLKEQGVEIVELTLHVGLGTFLPIRDDDIQNHRMHQEYFYIPESTVVAVRNAKHEGRRVVAVGTTVTRTLEYAADNIKKEQGSISGEADIFIYPGYDFKVVDAMITNFHAPKSTVLMMAAAFGGWDHLKAAYDHAVKHQYAFLSYGDSMLLQ